jgi:hypothetical protein
MWWYVMVMHDAKSHRELVFELDLCDHKASIGAKELIDLPSGFSMLHGVPVLLKGRPVAKGQ